jgi:ubiquinone/menaquinone biosynthesis C-methylase UbiE
MKQHLLSNREVLKGYDVVCELYPYIPTLSMWRAWEYAAYHKYRLKGRILDLGCGDGRYFHLLWPKVRDVVGIDMEPAVADLARKSGVYKEVHVVAAHKLPFADASFDAVFANCSLEHMDNLDQVLAATHRCLKPGGSLLCSVVTDNFVNWSLLPKLLTTVGYVKTAEIMQLEFEKYHHLANPLTVTEWIQRISVAGFNTEEHIPILPKVSSSMFLLLENLWHLKKPEGGELGEYIHAHITKLPTFASSFRQIVKGLLEMDPNPQECSGAVFLLKKLR